MSCCKTKSGLSWGLRVKSWLLPSQGSPDRETLQMIGYPFARAGGKVVKTPLIIGFLEFLRDFLATNWGTFGEIFRFPADNPHIAAPLGNPSQGSGDFSSRCAIEHLFTEEGDAIRGGRLAETGGDTTEEDSGEEADASETVGNISRVHRDSSSENRD